MKAKLTMRNIERTIRKGTRLRCQHLKKVATAIEFAIFDDDSSDDAGGISIEEIGWWLEQVGMDMELEYTGKEVGGFALAVQSVLYGYIVQLGLDPDKI